MVIVRSCGFSLSFECLIECRASLLSRLQIQLWFVDFVIQVVDIDSGENRDSLCWGFQATHSKDIKVTT